MSSDFCVLLKEAREAKAALRGAGGDLGKVAGDRAAGLRALLKARSKGECDNSVIYWDTVETCFGSRDLNPAAPLPGCVEPTFTPHHSLDSNVLAQLARLLNVVAYNAPDAPYVPLLHPIAGLLLEAGLTEEEVHEACCVLLAPPTGFTYVTQSRAGWETLRAALRPLARQYVGKCLSWMESEWGEGQVDTLLESWPWWLFEYLSPSHKSRVLDCYLMEGHKVLFRSALALLKTFYKQSGQKRKGEEDLEEAFKKLCQAPGVQPQELMTRAFKFPRFSKGDISKLTARLEVEARSRKLLKGGTNRRKSAGGGGGGGEGEGVLRAVGDNLAVRQGLSTPQPKPRGAIHVFPINALHSELLSREQLRELWQLLPDRIATITPTLAYSSDQHGTSLTTFYTRVDKWEPSFLLIRTTDQEVFGAFCSTSWGERNQMDDKGSRIKYFGTGECFLFRFTKSGIEHFPWVQPDSEDEEEMEGSGKSLRARELFMSGDSTMVTVGGG